MTQSKTAALFAAIQSMHSAGLHGVLQAFDPIGLDEAEDLVQMASHLIGLWGGDQYTGQAGATARHGRPLMTMMLRVNERRYLSVVLSLPDDASAQAVGRLDRMIRAQSCRECGLELGWAQWVHGTEDHEHVCEACADKEQQRYRAESPADAAL